MKAGRYKLSAERLEWARAKYEERCNTLAVGEIADRLGVSYTTLMHSLFPEKRVRLKTLRVMKEINGRGAPQEGA